MNAQEIRDQPVTSDYSGLDDPQRLAVGGIGILQELAAQVAELNESRKPRWVNISSSSDPWLLDATQVIGLMATNAHNSAGDYLPVVYIRVRGLRDPYTVWNMDHDEVRAKLGIDENWLQPPAPYNPGTISVSQAEWNAATTMLAAAKAYLTPPAGDPMTDYFSPLKKAVAEFDDFQMPF